MSTDINNTAGLGQAPEGPQGPSIEALIGNVALNGVYTGYVEGMDVVRSHDGTGFVWDVAFDAPRPNYHVSLQPRTQVSFYTENETDGGFQIIAKNRAGTRINAQFGIMVTAVSNGN